MMLSPETVITGVSIVVLGFLVDRFGPRLPSIPQALAFGIGLMAMAALPNSEVLFYGLCLVIGAGAGAVNPIAHAIPAASAASSAAEWATS